MKLIDRALAVVSAGALGMAMFVTAGAVTIGDELPDYGEGEYNSELPRVIDEAGLISYSTEEKLNKKIEKIIEDWEFVCVILTVDDYRNSYNSIWGVADYGIWGFADDFFDYGGYGVGENYDGIIMVVSMADRSYHFSVCGYGQTAFTEYGFEYLDDTVVSKLSDGDYDECFETFVDEVYDFVKEAKTARPYDTFHKKISGKVILRNFLIAAPVALLISWLFVKGLVKKMKPIMPKPAAREYLKNFNQTYAKDTFLFANVSKIPKGNGGSGGGGGHISSSGRSHGGHGGHF